MKTAPYVTLVDGSGYAVCCNPSPAIGPVWWTGASMTSAALRPRIKFYKTKEAAEALIPKAAAIINRAMAAQY